jgi:hypothetical protein
MCCCPILLYLQEVFLGMTSDLQKTNTQEQTLPPEREEINKKMNS